MCISRKHQNETLINRYVPLSKLSFSNHPSTPSPSAPFSHTSHTTPLSRHWSHSPRARFPTIFQRLIFLRLFAIHYITLLFDVKIRSSTIPFLISSHFMFNEQKSPTNDKSHFQQWTFISTCYYCSKWLWLRSRHPSSYLFPAIAKRI